jgi:hypothetical protein
MATRAQVKRINANVLLIQVDTRHYIGRGSAVEIYIVPETQLVSDPSLVVIPGPSFDQQVSINRFFGQGLANFVSYSTRD